MNIDLKALLALGDKMHEALVADDFETFYELVDEREKLVGKLSPQNTGAPHAGLKKTDAQVLEKQYNQIMNLLDEKEHHMMQQLRQIDQLKKAGKSYNSANYQRRQLINRKLLG